MSKSFKKELLKTKESNKVNDVSQSMKALVNSRILSNFETNFQFTKQLGIELLKGTSIPEHHEVLKNSIEGIREFIAIIEEELGKIKDK